jgi:2-oxoisovalerate dehydrogenase E1 component alpha subunit
MAITVANFEVRYYGPISMTDENTALLKKMYHTMVLTRLFDAKAVALQRTGKLGTYASCLGQEAVATGIGYALDPKDVFVTCYRDYATQILRGVSLVEILSYWGGSERGNNYQAAAAKEDLPFCIPIGSQCLHAAGIASAFKIRQQAHAALVTCGDGATSEGDFYETLNVAGAWQLPLVIVINNNQWAISIPRDKQSHAQTLAQKAIAGGIEGEQVDGNDVLAVQQRVSLALQKARKGGGPTVIEAMTYRLSDHTTADDASRYRDKSVVDAARQKDPVPTLKNLLIKHQQWSEKEEQTLIDTCNKEIDTAVNDYLNMPPEPFEHTAKFHYDESYHAG